MMLTPAAAASPEEDDCANSVPNTGTNLSLSLNCLLSDSERERTHPARHPDEAGRLPHIPGGKLVVLSAQ